MATRLLPNRGNYCRLLSARGNSRNCSASARVNFNGFEIADLFRRLTSRYRGASNAGASTTFARGLARAARRKKTGDCTAVNIARLVHGETLAAHSRDCATCELLRERRIAVLSANRWLKVRDLAIRRALLKIFRDTFKDRATGERKPAMKWSIAIMFRGERLRFSAFRDKSASEQFGRKLERLASLCDAGEIPDAALSQWVAQLPTLLRDRLASAGLLDERSMESARPLCDVAGGKGRRTLVDEFEAALLARGNSPGHVNQTSNRVRAVISGCDFRYWNDIEARKVEQYLSRRRSGTGDEEILSPKTSNYLLQSIRQFCGWMVTHGLATADPLRSLRPLNCRADVRVRRRALTPDELRILVRATETGPSRDRMSGSERALLYRLAVETGLRRAELMSLRVSSFDCAKPQPTVKLLAAYSKRRRDDVVPVRPALAAALHAFLQGRPATSMAFGMARNWNAAETIQEDLAAAGVLARDADGKVIAIDDHSCVVDFHALRHTFISNLVNGGVQPKVAQALARHSTITLTLDRYTHLRAGDELKALETLPDLGEVQANATPEGDGN